MSKKLKWSELKELRDLVATQNVALLTAVLETVKTNKKHFDTVTVDRNYVFGTLDTLNKNTADIRISSDRVNELILGIIKDTMNDTNIYSVSTDINKGYWIFKGVIYDNNIFNIKAAKKVKTGQLSKETVYYVSTIDEKRKHLFNT